MLDQGDALPDLTLSDHTGTAVSVADLGKAVIFFYPKAMTPGCTAEACDFRDRYERLQAEGYEVIGVSPDAPGLNARFVEKERLTYRLLSDEDHAFAEAVGAWGEKKNYGKVYEGLIRSTLVTGDDGTITHAFRNVRAKGHAARIASELGIED
jgi:peroxiredoxin Q/BCP